MKFHNSFSTSLDANQSRTLSDPQEEQLSPRAAILDTSSLYSVTFTCPNLGDSNQSEPSPISSQSYQSDFVTIAHGGDSDQLERSTWRHNFPASAWSSCFSSTNLLSSRQAPNRTRRRKQLISKETVEASSKETSKVRKALSCADSNSSGCLPTNFANTIVGSRSITSVNTGKLHGTLTSGDKETNAIESEDDWILVEDFDCESPPSKSQTPTFSAPPKQLSTTDRRNKLHSTKLGKSPKQLQQMALDKTDVELIKASWTPMRKDPVGSGVLLFKGLFTKFPQYLKFFSQFSELDLERMRDNKRLVKHAVTVIETVTFVVDSVGNESMATQLNNALVNLVQSHLKRKIGLNEFRNLGIVLIDFICDVNQRRRRGSGAIMNIGEQKYKPINKSSTSDSSNHSSYDSETMTSALDKIRAASSSSPSSSSEEENYLAGIATNTTTTDATATIDIGTSNENNLSKHNSESTVADGSNADDDRHDDTVSSSLAKIDTNVLVAAWTKLYSSVLDLVKREEEKTTEQ